MKNFIIFVALISSPLLVFAGMPLDKDTSVYSYRDENGALASIEIYDVENVYGEERISWQQPLSAAKISLQFLGARHDGYEAGLVVKTSGGQILADLNLSLSLGDAFEQIKRAMIQKDFRDSFAYLPESCDGKSVGFVLISNNLNLEMKGYCLSK